MTEYVRFESYHNGVRVTVEFQPDAPLTTYVEKFHGFLLATGFDALTVASALGDERGEAREP
jgi:hypothetical protein